MFALSRAPEDGQDVPNRSGITIQTYMNEPHRLIYTDKPNFSAHTLRLRVGRTQSSLACRMGAREGRAPDNQGNLAHLRHPRRLRRPTSRHVARHHLCVVHVSTRARNSAPTADRQRTPYILKQDAEETASTTSKQLQSHPNMRLEEPISAFFCVCVMRLLYLGTSGYRPFAHQ